MPLRRGCEVVGEEWTREPPVASESRIEAIENADGESDRFEGKVCPAKKGLDQRDGGSGQGSRGGDEVDEVDGGA